MIFQVENMLKENGDKLTPEVKSEVETALAGLKEAHKAQDVAAIDAAIAKLNDAAQKMYAAAQQAGAQAGPQQAGPQPNAGQQTKGDDNVQDADFEEVK